jgi:hypothetical protein
MGTPGRPGGDAGRDSATAAADGPTLLERLRALLGDGAPHSLASLAADLDTTPALVEAMVADLVRRGFLRERSAACCAGQCAGCPMAGDCTLGRIWEMEVDSFPSAVVPQRPA